jgi:hypothetical protein
MRIARLIAALISTGFLTASGAAAKESWMCNLAFDDAPDHVMATLVEIETSKILVYDNDMSGKPNVYSIVKDTKAGVIATTSFDPNQLAFVVIRRELGQIVLRSIFANSKYEDRMSGSCTRRP